MIALDRRPTTIFAAIVDDYDAQRPERRRRLLHHPRTGGGEGFNGWGDARPAVGRDDLDDLYGAGLIGVDLGSSDSYLVKPTREGRQGLQAMRRERTLDERSQPVNLS